MDASCGEGIGELGTVLYLERFDLDCGTGDTVGLTSDAFHNSLQEIPIFDSGAFGPESNACLRYGVFFRQHADGVTEEMIQAAQSDYLEWRFQFSGTSP